MDNAPVGTPRLKILIGLCLALGLPFCHLGDLGRRLSGLGPLFGGEILWWVLFAAILLYVVLVEHRALSSIGFRRPAIVDLALAVLAAFVMFMGVGMIYQLLLPALHINIDRQLGSVIATPLWFRLLTVTRAAVVEETAFRGYGLERLRELTGSKFLAAVVTWFLFTAVHLTSWGWGQLIIAAFGGLILTLLYVWRGNLWANIIAHWLTDGSAFILLPILMRHH
ncbi:MAG TPA: type II CAAX endopeptidase family protein [Chthoniobacterales bacterium]